jgi:hypothetical protein
MHILQYIAVKAETADEAYDLVESKLQQDLDTGSWYDWYVVGGGRFNVSEDEDWQEAYKEGKTNMIISSDNVELFEQIIVQSIDNRMVEFNRYRDEYERSAINLEATLYEYDGTMDYSMRLYPVSKMIDMYQGKWDYNSYFYDLENWSTNPKWMTEDRINNGGIWYLVPVDFHH